MTPPNPPTLDLEALSERQPVARPTNMKQKKDPVFPGLLLEVRDQFGSWHFAMVTRVTDSEFDYRILIDRRQTKGTEDRAALNYSPDWRRVTEEILDHWFDSGPR